jgi:hypothetical protein
MGVTNWLRHKRMSDPVAGSFQLTSCTVSGSSAVNASCHMSGLVTAPGVDPVAVEHRCTAPTQKWPQPGQVLPVRVDRADPTRLEISWDQVLTGQELGLRRAEQQAQADAEAAAEAAQAPAPDPAEAAAAAFEVMARLFPQAQETFEAFRATQPEQEQEPD